MHAAAINLRGGVSPRGARLRGQSIIEYVLIIAVIGLVIVFAGPGVAGAIRNQFNLVGNTVNNGTVGGTEGGGVSGGGSTGADSATVQAAIAKDAKDWTLGEQKAVADDIAAKGEASPAYAKAKAAMDAGTKFSVKLTDGKTLTYRIIGINHDNLADGSGKAGLTFLTTSTGIQSRMNATNTNAGGWEKSELRAKMNSGEIWNLMPSDFQSKVKAVRNLTNNVGGTDKNAAVTATSDKLFLLSYSEIVPTSYWASSYPWTSSEGTQYEAFKGKVTENYSGNDCLKIGYWWERSAYPYNSGNFLNVNSDGDPSDYYGAASSNCVCPAFSF
jgi:Flp pilus assembly pilin Flp